MKKLFLSVSFVLTAILLASPEASAQTNLHWKKVSSGTEFNIALRSDSTLWSWGFNQNGQLGLGHTTQQAEPAQVPGNDKWIDVSAGGFHVLAIKADSTLWSWGLTGNGQGGTGTTAMQYSVPQQVGAEHTWVKVSASSLNSFGIKADGTLWAWGWNGFGQVGDSTTTDRHTPYKINNDTNWKDVAGGYLHVLALKTDNSLWSWGFGGNGQLGNAANDTVISPAQIGNAADWEQISAGAEYSLARKTDGTIWSWGFNGNGQLGIGSTTDQNIPTQIGSNNNWRFIEAGTNFAFGITTDSALFGWGFNAGGNLGVGNTTQQFTSPMQEATFDSSWVSVSAAKAVATAQGILGFHAIGMKRDQNVLCAAGLNYVGQMGNGTTTDSDLFMCGTGSLITSAPAAMPENMAITAYPNPSNGLLYLQIEEATDHLSNFTIRNLAGQVVWQKKAGVKSGEKIDLSAFPKGMYLLEVTGGNLRGVRKIILQ
ncbi:MAG: T9SS type A sorting domain-containing protein [Chitinophagaceae bacterium]|nr:MAG: T9SS type A sorting domain-containing protein [Chitinophagaceae bacterium]